MAKEFFTEHIEQANKVISSVQKTFFQPFGLAPYYNRELSNWPESISYYVYLSIYEWKESNGYSIHYRENISRFINQKLPLGQNFYFSKTKIASENNKGHKFVTGLDFNVRDGLECFCIDIFTDTFVPCPPDYREYINSDKWREKRNKIIRRAGAVCEMCGSHRNIQVHHLSYDRLGFEHDNDLLCVCRKCHENIHSKL